MAHPPDSVAVSEPDSYDYVLFIDESGDDGLKRVAPIDVNGSSEWLCIGGLLIRGEAEGELVEWVKDFRQDIQSTQGPVLHFRDLSPKKRLRVCQLLAAKRVRAFVVCSNKKNMRGYNNERAAARGGKQWFYNYCVRLLMERATELCHADSLERTGSPKFVKVVFSSRGGHSYGQTKAYWEVLKMQAAGNTTYLNRRQIRHEVLRFGLVEYLPHYQHAGLQLADIVASAFYQAVDARSARWDVEPAHALAPIIYKPSGSAVDEGVVLQPSVRKAALTLDQRVIFERFGFRFEGVGPGL